jgi:hypothetical protein
MAYRYSLEVLLHILRCHAPREVERVQGLKRKNIRGLLSVGLKLHCLDGGPQYSSIISQLGGPKDILEVNLYRRAIPRSVCWVLPPVGNVEAAITLLGALERATGTNVFGNPNIQIQVCTPGRLPPRSAGILTIAFCLGTDLLRRFYRSDLATTFSNKTMYTRGHRLTLYDALGELDRKFVWWGSAESGRRLCPELPFTCERTDLFPATTPTDLRNINLIATLLVHEEYGGYWGKLGSDFRYELCGLLDRHRLTHLLNAPWVSSVFDEVTRSSERHEEDQRYLRTIQALMDYAFEDAKRLIKKPWLTILERNSESLLVDVRDLLARFHTEILSKSHAFAYS